MRCHYIDLEAGGQLCGAGAQFSLFTLMWRLYLLSHHTSLAHLRLLNG